jgi:uncharacterized protein (TIGR03435 family)
VRGRIVLLATFVIGSLVVSLLGQQQADQKPLSFEVASVKENHSGDGAQTFSITPDGSYRLTSATARMFIRQAYRLQDFQVVGAPSWTDVARYDVTAKSPSGVGEAAVPGMLQTLLRDRFGLVVHNEMREMPIYALALDRSNGALGPHIARTPSAASAECVARRSSRSAPDRSDGKPCGIGITGGSIVAGDATLSQLLGLLSPMVGRTTVDQTQLGGTFDYTLSWTPDEFQDRTASRDRERPIDPNAPSLFRALQEQLGLKLESTRGSVDVLVIDHVEKPTPD